MRVGVVGYSGQKFDKEKAELLFRSALNDVANSCLGQDIYQVDWRTFTFVSGLTNLGIPAIAYDFARQNSSKTMGIACADAKNHECFPCDRIHIVGEDWGDESETFLAAIDVLIRIGGGQQSMAETVRAKELGIPVFEQDLEAI